MDSKERFSNRVDMYVKYRPSYPAEAIAYLYETVGFRTDCDVADIGAGTGIFSRLLAEKGTRVIAVEPNRAMRAAAEQALGALPNFRALEGAAEETGLPDQSVDFIVCAQSFHWFDRQAAQKEFRRILKPGGKAVLIWNTRLTEGSPFLEQYDQLLKEFATDYEKVNHKNITRETLVPFFKDGKMYEAKFGNFQLFHFEELKGRTLSSSYVPLPGHPNYEPMLARLRELFDRTQQGGTVRFEYVTELFWGEV
jgi:SAM-dependent methyltransferase